MKTSGGMDIIEGSKKIAEFIGLKYIPFNDLQGFPKPGWWEVHNKEPKIDEVKVYNPTEYEILKGEDFEVVKVDRNLLKYNRKKGYITTPNYYAKFVCRNHADLRYYNDTDLLLSVLDKAGWRLSISFNEVRLFTYDKIFKVNYTNVRFLRQALFESIVKGIDESNS